MKLFLVSEYLKRSVVLTGVSSLLLSGLSANAAILGPLERKPDGRPFRAVKWKAETRCREQGGRLPTVTELVEVLNPEGLIERPSERDRARLASVWHANSGDLLFHYDATTYLSPYGPDRDYDFELWTNSISPPPFRDLQGIYYYTFQLRLGTLSPSYSDQILGGVRCVFDR